MLTQLLADRPEAVEELSSADRSRYARPGRPKVLHPAQGAAVQQDSGLGGFYDANIHSLSTAKYVYNAVIFKCSE